MMYPSESGVVVAQEWPDLIVSKTEVRRAGDVLRRWFVGELISESDVEAAQEVLTNWRAVHGFVRNTAAMGLRSRAERLGVSAEIASRTKARNSIYAKLAERPDLKLDALGDIAGARAVVPDLGDQDELTSAYDGADEVRRVLDYRDGKESGYRAVHLDLVLEDKHDDSRASASTCRVADPDACATSVGGPRRDPGAENRPPAEAGCRARMVAPRPRDPRRRVR